MIKIYNPRTINEIKEIKDNAKLAPEELVEKMKEVNSNLNEVTGTVESSKFETMGAIAELFETNQKDKIEIMGAIAELFEAVSGGTEETPHDDGTSENQDLKPIEEPEDTTEEITEPVEADGGKR